MGGARLLRPRSQPDRLRSAGRAARRVSAIPRRASQAPGPRRLHRGGGRGDCLWRASALVDRYECRTGDCPASRLDSRSPKRGAIRAASDEITPTDRAGDFAQAMMDLGATICRPRNPDCSDCPLQSRLRGLRVRRRPERFPRRSAQAIGRPLRRRPLDRARRRASGWSAGPPMACSAEWPRCPGPSGRDEPQPTGPAHWQPSRHLFTHFKLELPFVAVGRPRRADGWWQPLDALVDAGLPTLYRRAVEAVLEAREPLRPEPFFSGPGIDRADHLRVDEARLAESRAGKTRFSCCGATAFRPWATTGDWNGSQLRAADLFLGLRRRRAPVLRDSSSRMPTPARRSIPMACSVDGRGAVVRGGAQSRAGGTRAIASAPIAARRPRSSAAAGRGTARLARPSISRASTRW